MPYKNKEDYNAYMRKRWADYRFTRKVQKSVKDGLDILSRVLAEEYLRELVDKAVLLQKAKAIIPDHPEIKTAFDNFILKLADLLQKKPKDGKPRSIAHFFANGIWWLHCLYEKDGKFYNDPCHKEAWVGQSLCFWVDFYEKLLTELTYENLEFERSSYKELDSKWKELLPEQFKKLRIILYTTEHPSLCKVRIIETKKEVDE